MANNRELSQFANVVGYNGGNIGIGTDNPVGNLEVRDSKANLIVAKDGLTVKSNSDLHTTYDTLQVGAGGALLSYSTETATADTQFVHNAYRSSGGTFKYRYADTAARLRVNSPARTWIFESAASGSADADITFSEQLRISSGGRVAIGTDNPGSVLDIQRAAAGSEQMLQIRSHATAAGDFDGDYSVEIRHATSTVTHGMLISNKETNDARRTLDIADGNGVFATFTNGKFGVGTASPSSIIHGQVSSGSAIATLESTATSGEASVSLKGKNSSGTVRTGIFKYDNSDMLRIGTTASIPIRFETNDTERLRINSSGQVSLGSEPSSGAGLLNVKPSSGDEFLKIRDAGDFNASLNGVAVDTRNSANTASKDLVVRSQSLVLWQNASEKLRIDSGGRVQVGRSASDSSDSLLIVQGNAGDSGTGGQISIQRGGNANPTAPSDLGGLMFKDSAGSRGAVIAATCDGDWASNDYPTRLEFKITGDGDSSPTERMRITNSGTVRIGSSLGSNAAGRFQVVEERSSGDDNDCNAYFETNRQDWNIKTYYNRSGTHYHLVFVEQNTERGSIRGNDGSNVTFNQGSDYRWKENIVEMTGTEGIEICKRLKPSKYNWIENREQTGEINTVDGFIAHEVEEAGVLGAVVGEKDAVNEDGSIKGQLLDYGQMTPVLAAGIKGLIAKVETLETQNADLLARVTALEGS